MVDEPSQSVTKLLLGGAITAATGTLTALLPLISAKLSGREAIQRATDDLELASKKVAFWKSWVELRGSLAGEEEQAEIRKAAAPYLDEITAVLNSRLTLERQLSEATSLNASWTQRVFLLYKPRRTSTWVSRSFFYLFFLFIAVLIGDSIRDGSFRDWLSWLVLLLLLAVGAALRLISVRVDSLPMPH